jgi:hypothetical protein
VDVFGDADPEMCEFPDPNGRVQRLEVACVC